MPFPNQRKIFFQRCETGGDKLENLPFKNN